MPNSTHRDIIFVYTTRAIWFPFLRDFLKLNKVSKLIISFGREFQETSLKYLTVFFPWYSVLIFGTKRSDFERICVKLFFQQKCFQTVQTRDHVWLFMLAKCWILFSRIVQYLSHFKRFTKFSIILSLDLSQLSLVESVNYSMCLIGSYKTSILMGKTWTEIWKTP